MKSIFQFGVWGMKFTLSERLSSGIISATASVMAFNLFFNLFPASPSSFTTTISITSEKRSINLWHFDKSLHNLYGYDFIYANDEQLDFYQLKERYDKLIKFTKALALIVMCFSTDKPL